MSNVIRRHKARRFLPCLCIGVACLVTAVAATADDVPGTERVPGRVMLPDVIGGYSSTQIVVKFRSDVFPADKGGQPFARKSDGSRGEPRLSRNVEASLNRWGVTRMRRAFSHALKNPELASQLGMDRMFIIEVPQGTDTPAMAAALRAFGDEIESASIDGIGGVALIPNDTDFGDLWGLHNLGDGGATYDADIDAPEAWDIHTGNPHTVTIAIIDSGVDPHTEFADRMVPGINKYPDSPPDLTTDDCPHGTHVAGTAAATGNNGEGIAGVTWGANIMPVRVLLGCSGPASAAAEGITWAVNNGADICNISLQYYTDAGGLLESAVEYANANGVLLVAAAGNYPEFVAYPARYPGVMAISATNDNDNIPDWSGYGPQIDVSAPGEDILSTGPDNGYYTDLGTSMASPHVAGLAALIKSYVPGLTDTDIRGIISDTADDLGAAGWDEEYGWGRINAHTAMLAADAMSIRVTSSNPPDGAIDARQTSDPYGANPAGWDRINLTFDGDASGLLPGDFSVETEGGAYVPEVLTVTSLPGSDTITVVLDSSIPPGAWTTIRHDYSGTGARLGYLPGDANGDRTSAPADVLTVIDGLNGVIELEIWQSDLDRDGTPAPADILRVIDLLNGAGVYDEWLNVTLP